MAVSLAGGDHGLWKVVIQKVGSNGTSYGQAGSSIANGSTSQAYVGKFPKTEGLAVPDRTVIEFTGGDRWITSFQYGINSLGSFEFTCQDTDANLVALTTGTNVDQTTNTEWAMYTENTLQQSFSDFSIMFIYRMQSFETATFGQTYYVHTIVPRCTISPKLPAKSYQSPSDYAYQVTPKSNAREIRGLTLGSNLGATDNIVSHYHIIAENPLYMFVMRANGTSATAVSAYKPVTSTVGTASATKNAITKVVSAGTATAGVADTITVATGSFAIGTALTCAAGDLLTVLHETAYEAV